MAFDFLGTSKWTWWRKYRGFCKHTDHLTESRIVHLDAEKRRKSVYLEKLRTSSSNLGGKTNGGDFEWVDKAPDIPKDMRRSVISSTARFDGDAAVWVARLKEITKKSIKYRRENLEFRIKDTLDYIEQLDKCSKVLAGGDNVEGEPRYDRFSIQEVIDRVDSMWEGKGGEGPHEDHLLSDDTTLIRDRGHFSHPYTPGAVK